MNISTERRHDPRVRVQVRLELTDDHTGSRRMVRTVDLSVGGARCAGDCGFHPDQVVKGRLFLPVSEGGRDVDLPVRFQARVVAPRTELSPTGQPLHVTFGLAFTDMDAGHAEELRQFLYEWMAADSWSHACLSREARP